MYQLVLDTVILFLFLSPINAVTKRSLMAISGV